MGSRYRPARRDDGRQRYDARPPPPAPRRRLDLLDRRDDRHDAYGHDAQYRPSYDDRGRSQDSHHPPPPPREAGSGYVFRGADARDRNPEHSRREDQFTFAPNAELPSLRFPSAHEQPLPPRPNRRGHDDRPRRDNGRPPRRTKPGQPTAGRRFGPRPAHARDLLTRSTREVTPEQLAGMNADSQLKFRDVPEDEFFSGSDDTNDHSDGDGGPLKSRKRRKVQPDEEDTRPKWSNPDPYTALPPPSQTNGPKKDIVEAIRKAKIDSMGSKGDSSNPVKDNIDFISFDDDEIIAPSEAESDSRAPAGLDDRRSGGRAGRKRGHSEMSSDGVLGGLIVAEWEAADAGATPWMLPNDTFTSNVGLKLHKEIVDFYEFVRPLDYENTVRQEIATRIEKVIRGWYHGRGVQIYCFGSFPAGLYLPTADMDLVALSPQYMSNGTPAFCLSMPDKRKLRNVLRSAGVFDPVRGADIIGFAKVPLIKFTDLQTGLKVDISFENDSGLQAQDTLKRWKEQFPDMPVLVALIKQFLAMRNLNEVFRGGIGGFTIICLVVSMLQHMPEYQAGSLDPHTRFGDLLLNFFDLYGNKFNYQTTGIIMEPPAYFDKERERNRINVKYQDDRLTIIDPNRPDNDISGGSRLIEEVFSCFRGAHALVQRRLDQLRKTKGNSGSILECILGGNYSSYIDARAKMHRVFVRNHPEARMDPRAQPRGLPLGPSLPAKPPAGGNHEPSRGQGDDRQSHFQPTSGHPQSNKEAPESAGSKKVKKAKKKKKKNGTQQHPAPSSTRRGEKKRAARAA